ncbi:MAG TPA: hypothetical protein VNR66_04050 [Solirubrobacteraceae bacterium]|nr:hypothetical protein [Solirubrobacteraceae bacterium]
MSPERVQAYRRVVHMLDELGPSKLLADEQERIRHAADNLIFSGDLDQDVIARESLGDMGDLCRELVASKRWEQVTATRLADSIAGCGPEPVAELEAA